MNTALRLSSGPRSIPPTAARPADPFPERITSGCDKTARALRAHAASARVRMEHTERQVEKNADRDDPTGRSRAALAAQRYRTAARTARAFERLAGLHERREMPSPLFTVRTRRHVRALLSCDTYGQDTADALKTALRWTLGLPMSRPHGFGIMREGFERLGLLAPIVLPLAVAQALRSAETDGEDAPAPSAPASEVARATEEDRPVTTEAYVELATARAAVGWIGHVTQFPQIDFAEAFGLGLSVRAAVEAARDWITGAVVFGPLPFAWGAEDGTGRPFRRDEAGRLRSGRAGGDDPAPTPSPTTPPGGEPGGGGETSQPAPEAPPAGPKARAQADRLDAQAATAEAKAERQRGLYAGMNLTRRRAQHRAAGMKEAERLTIYATALRAVAAALRAGTCPPALTGVSTRSHVERLVGVPSGPDARVTVPRFPGTEPCRTEWGEASRQKSLRALARMGIENAEQFEAAVAALARLMDAHDDPEADARQREAEVERRVEAARLSGIPDYFRTPSALVEQMIDAAGLYGTGRSVRILEPSAGDGAILDVLRERHPEARVDAVEPSHTLRQIIEAKGHATPFGRPFEHFEPSAPYDAVVMNPPFGRGGIRAMDHVERAASMLAPGGRLVAVVPESCHFRLQGRYRAFRAFVEDRGGYWIDLPADAFRESGTGVKARLIVLDERNGVKR